MSLEHLLNKGMLAEFIDKMATHIEEGGWRRNGYGDERVHTHCVAGAARCLLEYTDDHGLSIRSLDDIFRGLGFDSEGDLIMWNDYKVDNKEHAIQYLREKAVEVAQST